MEILGITLTAWSALIVTLSALVMAATMFVIGTRRVHYVWACFCLAVAVYAVGFFMVASVDDPESARFWWKIEYIGTILIPFIFLHFVLDYLGRARRWVIGSAYLAGLVLVYVNLKTDLIINQVTFMFGELYYNSPPGLLHPLLVAIYVVLITYAHYLLIKAYRASKDAVVRTQIRLFFVATSVGFIGGVMNFIAVYGVPLHPATQLTIIIAMPLIGFAILRYKLFGLRAVWAQFLAFILSSFALIQLILSESRQEYVLNSFLLAFVLVIGAYLVRSVRKELEVRGKVEKLAEDLKKANARLQEIDLQKSEFVSIASHQLKSPLTAIKGYASMLLEGSFGEISPKVKNAADRIFKSSGLMVNVVEDFLNISRVEQGRMQYEMIPIDLTIAVRTVLSELGSTISASGLTVEANIPDTPIMVMADAGKIRQVILNLADNAIKYTPKGSVHITLEQKEKKAVFSVRDSGIGISKDFVSRLFGKFNRSEQGRRIDANGSGIGLYLAREILKAHKGRIWAESEGEGKGSTFFVELPIA